MTTTARLADGAANATVNRELSALKRMLRLGEIAGKVTHRPILSLLREHNTRTGFFEEPEFRAVVKHLPEDLRALFEVAYLTGWRVKSELLTRQWAQWISGTAGFGWNPARQRTTKAGCSRSRRCYEPCWSGSVSERRHSSGQPERSPRPYSIGRVDRSNPSGGHG